MWSRSQLKQTRTHVDHLRQAWCPIFMGLIYTCFNATYILAFEGTDIYGNPYIYSFLNWKKDPLKSAMISLGNILVLFVLFLAYYFLAKFRDFFWARYMYDDAFDNQKARKISRVWRLIKTSVTIMCRNDELSWLFTNILSATR